MLGAVESPEPSVDVGWPRQSLAALIDAAPVAILVSDATGVIRLANRAAERLFDYPRDALRDRPIDTLVPAANRAAHGSMRAAFFAHPRAGNWRASCSSASRTKPTSWAASSTATRASRPRPCPPRCPPPCGPSRKRPWPPP